MITCFDCFWMGLLYFLREYAKGGVFVGTYSDTFFIPIPLVEVDPLERVYFNDVLFQTGV